MSEFTAPNGYTVAPDQYGDYSIRDPRGRNTLDHCAWLDEDDMRALREFFQKENDDRLGRWRWPANPEYVVYAWTADPARTARGVTVLSESIPRGYTVWEDNIDTLYGTSENEEARALARKAAHAWFDDHPEPKPWHDAECGEVWRLTIDGVEYAATREYGPGFRLSNSNEIFPRDERITAGRRIWPEVAS